MINPDATLEELGEYLFLTFDVEYCTVQKNPDGYTFYDVLIVKTNDGRHVPFVKHERGEFFYYDWLQRLLTLHDEEHVYQAMEFMQVEPRPGVAYTNEWVEK